MKKIELPTALIVVATIVCLTVTLLVGPPDVRTQMLAAIGSFGTVVAGLLPRLIAQADVK